MSTLSWQAGNASGSFLTGTIVQALLVVNYPDYTPQAWQGTLFVFAMVLILFLVNIWGAPLWALIQNGLMVLHILFFLVVIIVLWVMAPHQSAKAVFTGFSNEGGWNSMGLSLMVGQITAIYSLLGKCASSFFVCIAYKIQVPMQLPTSPKKSEMLDDMSPSPFSGVTLQTASWPSFSSLPISSRLIVSITHLLIQPDILSFTYSGLPCPTRASQHLQSSSSLSSLQRTFHGTPQPLVKPSHSHETTAFHSQDGSRT